ncbi:MAG: serine/threonine-protein kinase, partial [bacterium]
MEKNKKFGKYRILNEIGRGGMGIVYKAVDTELGREVAVKILNDTVFMEKDQSEQRFKREIESTARLQHPNIISLHDFGTVEGRYFFTMDIIEGCSLHELLSYNYSESGNVRIRDSVRNVLTKKKQAAPQKSVTSRHKSRQKPLLQNQWVIFMLKIARALAHTHERGIIHRDLKPSNILIDKNGEPIILDFGFAKQINADANLSISGCLIGTPLYMSPEQAEGKSDEVDERSDVYAMGVLFYEILCGRPPVTSVQNLIQDIYNIINQEPKGVRQFNSRVSRDLELICSTALAKEKSKRYQTAGAFAVDLEHFLEGEPINAKPPGIFYKIGKKIKKHKTISISAAALFILFSFFLAYWNYSAKTIFLVQKKSMLMEKRLEHEKRKEDANWILAWEDDFERETLGDNWLVFPHNSSCTLIQGRACIVKDRNKLYSNRHVVGNIRIEFDVWKHERNEIACFLKCDTTYRKSGKYYYIWANGPVCRIEKGRFRSTGHLIIKDTALEYERSIFDDKKYHAVIQCENDKLSFMLNGEKYAEGYDLFPYNPNENFIWGFYGIENRGDVFYDNVRVYKQLLPEKISVTCIGDIYYNRQMYGEAEHFFRDIMRNYASGNIKKQACRKIFALLKIQNKYNEMVQYLLENRLDSMCCVQAMELIRDLASKRDYRVLSDIIKDVITLPQDAVSRKIIKGLFCGGEREDNGYALSEAIRHDPVFIDGCIDVPCADMRQIDFILKKYRYDIDSLNLNL